MVATWTAFYNWVAGIDPRISGIFIGFFLSQGATFLRDWLTDRKQAKVVRKMLELEIEHNLSMLAVLEDSLKTCADEIEQGGASCVPKNLIDFITHSFHRKTFESQISLASIALSEKEITKVYEFHSFLSFLTPLLNNIKESNKKDSMIWLKVTLDTMKSMGNPLSGKAEPTEKPSSTS